MRSLHEIGEAFSRKSRAKPVLCCFVNKPMATYLHSGYICWDAGRRMRKRKHNFSSIESLFVCNSLRFFKQYSSRHIATPDAIRISAIRGCDWNWVWQFQRSKQSCYFRCCVTFVRLWWQHGSTQTHIHHPIDQERVDCERLDSKNRYKRHLGVSE